MPRLRNSSKKTALNAVEQYELNQWLEQNQIASTNLRRSFTDVLPLARLLSRYYPDLIDLNYYPPRNSVHNKLCNWESFNKRVLQRLGLHLTRDQMVRVARSIPGSVDLLLYSIMRVQLAAERKAREAKETSDDEDDNDNDNDHNANTTENASERKTENDGEQAKQTEAESELLRHNDSPLLVSDANAQRPRTLKQAQAALRRSERGPRVQTTTTTTTTMMTTPQLQKMQRGEPQQQPQQPQRTVLYSHYMQAVKQLQRRNAKIARFDQLSAHLENMLQLKSERIDELQQQVAAATARLNNHQQPPQHPPADADEDFMRNPHNTLKHRHMRRNTIQALTEKIRIPGFGYAGCSFPLKLTPIT